jgi:hypothetical protein
MRVRLTRKLANELDGVNLSECQVGDLIELPDREASLLVAEEWAIVERRTAATPLQFPDRRSTDTRPPFAHPDSRAS